MKPDDLFETQEEFRKDEIEEFIRYNPSKAIEHLNENTYYAIAEELIND